jgi:hypothetical protein
MNRTFRTYNIVKSKSKGGGGREGGKGRRDGGG